MSKLKENYQVLIDEKAFDDFVNWLPDLESGQKFYACLFARKKYTPELPWIKSDKSQLKRFLTDKERFKFKVRQLHCEYGAYVVGQDNMVAPQESLALYVTPNPRDMYKATWGIIRQAAKLLESQSKGYNLHQEAMSEVQRSKFAGSPFIMFDLDWKDEDKLAQCVELVDGHCDIIETRGGYHLFVLRKLVKQITNKMWHVALQKHADVCGDNLTPVVGCVQGGFVPRFIFRDGSWL